MSRLAAALFALLSLVSLAPGAPDAIRKTRGALFYDDQFPWYDGIGKYRLSREWYQA